MNAAGKKYAVRGYTAGSNWKKIAENQYFYVNLTGKEQKIELPENGYGVLQEKKMEDTCTLQAFDGELVIC